MSLDASQIQALLDGPAAEPPSGVVPHLVNAPNDLYTGRAVCIVTLVLCTLALSLRLYTKAFVIGKIHAADCKASAYHYATNLLTPSRCCDYRMGE